MKTTRRLVLVACAALALTAATGVATAAAATEFRAAQYPAILKGADGEGNVNDMFSAFGSSMSCHPPSFRSASQQGPTSTLAVGSYDATGKCIGWNGTAPLLMNGCKLTFQATSDSSGTVSIGPAGCGPIVIENVYAGCDYLVKPGAKYSGAATLNNKGEAAVISASLTGLEVTGSGGPLSCPPGTSEGSWSVDWLVTAENLNGEPLGVRLGSADAIAYYPINEGSGTTVVDAAGPHDGTIAGATWTASGRYGSALDFDGVDDLVEVADAAALDFTSAFTLEAWVRLDTASGTSPILSKGENPPVNGYLLSLDDLTAKPRGWVANSGSFKSVNGLEGLTASAWSHVAFTFDGKVLKMYVEGELANSKESSIVPAAGSGDLEIGHSVLIDSYFDGRIDEVRLYDEALSEDQIWSDLNSAL